MSAYNLCKQLEPRSGRTEHWSQSGSKPFDTLIVILKEFFEKLILRKVSRRQQQKHEKLSSMKSNNTCLRQRKIHSLQFRSEPLFVESSWASSYDKCSKILNTFLCSQIKCWLSRLKFRIASKAVPDQIASYKSSLNQVCAVCLNSFLAGNLCLKFYHIK